MVTTLAPSTSSTMRSITHAEQAEALHTLMLAFAADPVVRWMYPDPQQYLTHFAPFAQAFAGRAFDHGAALRVEDGRGVALWLPPDVHADELEIAALLEQSVHPNRLNDVHALLEHMQQYTPVQPHWYLPLLGVDPAHHGRGLGSRLLQHVLAICDRDRLPAYLEATSPRNVALYRRHGFRATGMIQLGTSPVIVPMLREPQ